MKKLALFAAALVLTFGLAQCKKEQTQTEGKTVHITVKATNGGSKANVDPSNGHITFNNGDKLYVGYNSACVGTLTYSGSAFSGSVADDVVGTQPLHFYYLGGAAATVVDATHYSADISDQSSNYPVISYGTSTTDYTGSGSYETTLLNKCALVKFNLATGTDASVSVGGLYTKATIDFANPGVVTPGTTGSITLHEGASNTERWAILLPQAGVTATATISGYTCSIASFPDVAINDYNTTGVDIAMTPAWDGDLAHITSESTEAFATATDGMTITGTLGVIKKISIADGATVTLNNVTINGTNGFDYKWAGITCVGDATIILKDGSENTVKGFYEDYPGIFVPSGKTLTIKGSGSLTASSNGYGAGIGGGFGISCGNIEIQGGIITATGGWSGAGIGAGSGIGAGESICGTITISGGTVTAIGGSYAAGIGSGYAQTKPSTCGAISISGGTVSATAGALAPAALGKGAVDGGESTCASVTFTLDITSLTLTNTNSDVPGIVSDFINATAVNADTNPITYMLPTSVTDPAITGGMDYYGFATSYDGGTKTWTITKKE